MVCYKYLQKIFIVLLIIHVNVCAERYVVSTSNSVTVIINGKELYLNPGDVLEAQRVDGWKRIVSILETSNSNVPLGLGVIGNIRFGELVSDADIKSQNSSYKLKKSIEIIGQNGEKFSLIPGDQIEIGEVDGWKRELRVISSSSRLNSSAKYYIGDKTFSDLTKNGAFETIFLKPEVREEVSDLDSFIQNLLGSEVTGEAVDESVEAECPQGQKTFKINKSISIVKTRGKQDIIPEGSVINTIKTEKGVCHFKILRLPDGSNLELNDFPDFAMTYPSNLASDNLEEYSSDKKIDLTRGVVFSPNDGVNIQAIGRRTGKAYTFSRDDKIKVKGIHPNGSYIVTKNNENAEYRIQQNELDELNESGAIDIRLEDTVGEVSRGDLFNTITTEDDCQTCHELNTVLEEDVPLIEDELNFESCRVSDVKTKSGKILKANNYLDKIFNVSNSEAREYLSDTKVSNLATCISRSMHHGTNRNANPSCAKDANGNIKPSPIRTSRKNAAGKHIGWNIVNPVPRACASMQASAFMAKRFQMAADCLGVDSKEVFPIINHESHFGASAISPSFAIGAGQIVTENYVDFYNGLNQAKKYITSNHRYFQEAQNFKTLKGYTEYENLPGSRKLPRTTTFFLSDIQDKLAQNNPSCAGLKQIYDNPFQVPESIKKNDRSVFNYVRERENERLCRPKNPDESMYMSMIYYLTNKKYSQFYLAKVNSEIGGKISSAKLNDWSIILSRYMYNGGAGGILSVFQTFIRDLKAGKVNELDLKGNTTGRKLGTGNIAAMSNSDFKNYVSHYIKYRYPSKSTTRKNEVAKYVTGVGGIGGIEGDLRQIEKEGRGVCGSAY